MPLARGVGAHASSLAPCGLGVGYQALPLRPASGDRREAVGFPPRVLCRLPREPMWPRAFCSGRFLITDALSVTDVDLFSVRLLFLTHRAPTFAGRGPSLWKVNACGQRAGAQGAAL